MTLIDGTKIDTRKLRRVVVRATMERVEVAQSEDAPSTLIVSWDGPCI
jgi:hypothetical protein